MTDVRPNPIAAISTLRILAKDWRTIESMIVNGEGASQGATSGYGSTVPAPSLMSLSQTIDTFARFHARCLLDESDWQPKGLDTPSLIEGLASRIGHFTHTEDARLAWDFQDELDDLSARAKAAVNPDGNVWVEVGHHCSVEDCTGRMKVRVNRDNGFNAGWRPMAYCFTVDDNGVEHMSADHEVDGLLLAATADLVAA